MLGIELILQVLVFLTLLAVLLCVFVLVGRVSRLYSMEKKRRAAQASSKLAAFYNNGFVQAHRAGMGGDISAPMVTTFSFDHVCDSLNLRPAEADMNTVICSIAIGDGYMKSIAPCIESQRRFAEQRGFGYVLMDRKPLRFDRPIPWLKIPLIAALLRAGYRQVLFIDADAMITDHDFDIDSQFSRLTTAGKGLLLSQDGRGVNTGVVFAIDISQVQRALDMIWTYDVDIENSTWEQNATNILLNTYPEFRQAFIVEREARTFNSFAPERENFLPTVETMRWKTGDFICHFAGIRTPELDTLTRKYAAKTQA